VTACPVLPAEHAHVSCRAEATRANGCVLGEATSFSPFGIVVSKGLQRRWTRGVNGRRTACEKQVGVRYLLRALSQPSFHCVRWANRVASLLRITDTCYWEGCPSEYVGSE
jgi:hypothetical protein